MEFALSQDQVLMQDSLRTALARACPMDRLRAVADCAGAFDAQVWATVRELGIPGLLVPEEHGGLGLSLLEAALASEELGRRAAPVPFLATSVLAPIALKEAGSPQQQAKWLPRLATGEAIIGVAFSEQFAGARDGAGLRLENGKLHGTALFVVDSVQADALLVATADASLYLVTADDPALLRTPLRAVDATRPMLELHFNGVEAESLPGACPSLLERLRAVAWIMLAADILGAGWNMIDKSVAYAMDRRQFGRAIGSFQAVKHMCAEMAAELEVKRALVWYAAYAFDHKPDDLLLYAAHAKALLGDAGAFVARTSTEVHGGMGITDELGLHYWFKRIATDRLLYGGPHQARRHAAVLQR